MRFGKRLLGYLLACLMLYCCTGCGGDASQPEEDPADTGTTLSGNAQLISSGNTSDTPAPMPPEEVIEKYNVVIVLDSSKSMGDADQEEKAMNAACMFLNSLFISAEGSNQPGIPEIEVGIVAYNDDSWVVSGLSKLQSETSLYTIEHDIFSLSDRKGKDGGLGRAIFDAATMLSGVGGFAQGQPFPGAGIERNMIVLFTDGYEGAGANAFSPSVEANQGTQGLEAYLPNFGDPVQNDLEKGLNIARQSQTEIFVVGLDGGKLDASWPEFRKIANYTQRMMPPPPPMMNPAQPGMPSGAGVPGMQGMPPGGGSGIFEREADDLGTFNMYVNYRRAPSSMHVQSFYVQLLASMMQGTESNPLKPERLDRQSHYEIKVDTEGNSTLIFFLMSDNDIEEIIVKDPDERRVNLQADEYGWNAKRTARIRWWKGYVTISIMNPKTGRWSLSVQGVEGNSHFEVRSVLVGGILLNVSAEQISTSGDLSAGKVRVTAVYHGAPMDKSYYSGVTCLCTMNAMPPMPAGDAPLQSPDMGGFAPPPGPPPGGEMKAPVTIPLSYNDSEQCLEGVFNADYPGDYMIQFQMSGSESDYAKDNSYTKTAMVTFRMSEPETISFSSAGQTKSLPVALPGWKDAPVTASKLEIAPDGPIEADLDGGQLILKSVHAGSGTLTVWMNTLPSAVDGQSVQTWTVVYPVTVGG